MMQFLKKKESEVGNDHSEDLQEILLERVQ